MAKAIPRSEIIGKKYFMLTPIKELEKRRERNGRSNRYFLCKCDCGNEKAMRFNDFCKLHIKSCGCYNISSRKTHGMKKTRIYQLWASMKTRCYNENHEKYHCYGGRGIIVCEKWKDSFESFHEDMGNRPKNKTLDRIDNDKGYSKENCRWANIYEQNTNRKTVKMYKYKNTIDHVFGFSKKMRCSRNKILRMIRDGKMKPLIKH